MSKKNVSKVSFLYLLGTLATVIGFCLPITNGAFQGIAKAFGKTINGFSYINFDNFGTSSLGALLIFAGAAAGLAVAVLSFLKIKVPSANLLMIVLLAVSIVGGIILFCIAKDSFFTKVFGGKNALKQFFNVAAVGFYLIVGGWIAGILGITLKI